jgi:hypothetical protein
MGVIKGLKQIASYNKEQDDRRAAAADRVKVTWVKLSDGDSVKIRFLQELDEDSPNFSEKNGVGFIAVEHTAPSNFHNRAVCTADEGCCYACDRVRSASDKDERGKWKQRQKLYINVLVDNGKDEPFVAVLSQGNGAKSVTPSLIEFATDSPSITNRYFRIKRTGSGISDTSYTLTPGDPRDDLASVEDFEIYDLEKSVVRNVPLAEQADFYGEAEPSTTSSVKQEVNSSDIW